jgi:GTP1/Obg family GTP-binding protein
MINPYRLSASLSAILAAILVLLTPAIGTADETVSESEQATFEAQAEQIEVTDEKLQQFLSAAIQVQDVQREYVAEIQATEDPAKAETLREEAQEEMVTAVEDSGLSVLEFNLIAQRLQNDAELLQRLDSLQREELE